MEISTITSGLLAINNMERNQNIPKLDNKNQFANPQNILNALSFMGNDRIPEKDLCMLQLKTAKDNEGNVRFSLKETMDLYKELGRFETKAKKSTVLKKLLNIGKGEENNSYMLSFNDIANYLAVTSGAKVSEQAAIIDILDSDKMILQEEEFDEMLFIHLENNPSLIKTAGKLRNFIKSTYKGLPSAEQKSILSLSLGIMTHRNTDGEYYPHLTDMYKDIAKKMMSCSGVVSTIDVVIENTTPDELEKILPVLNEDNQFELRDGLSSNLRFRRQRAIDNFINKYSYN